MRPPPSNLRVRLPHVVVVPLLHRVAIVVAVLLRLVAPLRRRLRALCQRGEAIAIARIAVAMSVFMLSLLLDHMIPHGDIL